MTRRSKILPLLLLLLALPLGAGCLFSTPPKLPQPDPPLAYKPYYDPDPEVARQNLVDNFEAAWNNRDLAEYRDSILYKGTEEATDGEIYAPFTFYYMQDPSDPDPDPLPDYELYEREIQRVTNMFGGLPGLDSDGITVPGIRDIDLELTANNSWGNPTNPDDVEGDPYPAGTKWRAYSTNMLITLKGTYGEDTTGWNVDDSLIFHVIPVRVEHGPGAYHTVYKIWKWRDVIE